MKNEKPVKLTKRTIRALETMEAMAKAYIHISKAIKAGMAPKDAFAKSGMPSPTKCADMMSWVVAEKTKAEARASQRGNQ